MWLTMALWSSPCGRHGFHTKTWRWYELRTPRVTPVSGSCTPSFELAGARENVKYGSRSASEMRYVVSTISLSKSEWYLHSSSQLSLSWRSISTMSKSKLEYYSRLNLSHKKINDVVPDFFWAGQKFSFEIKIIEDLLWFFLSIMNEVEMRILFPTNAHYDLAFSFHYPANIESTLFLPKSFPSDI